MTNDKQHIALIDGYGFVFRAYHSLPPLFNQEKVPVGAVYGFTSMIMRLIETMKVTHAAIILDSGQKNFRHDLYDLYKANRPEAPEDLKPQFPLIRDAAIALNIAVIEKVGFEADDIIATYTKLATQENIEVTIISSDKDLMQLVSHDVKMFDPVKNKIIDKEGVKEKLGIYPEKVTDYLALVGDSSDNIPGVPSIGPKTAVELLEKYDNLLDIYNHLDDIQSLKKRDTLANNRDKAFLSYQLVSLQKDISDLQPFEKLLSQNIHQGNLINFLQKHGFKSLIARAQKQFNFDNIQNKLFKVQKNENFTISKIDTVESVEALYQQAAMEGSIVLVFFYQSEEISIIGCGTELTYSYIELEHHLHQNSLFEPNISQNHLILEKFKEILKDDSILKISYDIKSWLHKLNVDITAYDDLMSLSYLLDNGKISHDLQSILSHSLNIDLDDAKDLINNPKKEQILLQYLPHIKSLYQQYKQRIIEEKLAYLYERVDKQLITVLKKIEDNGVLVDKNRLQELSSDFSIKISKLENEIFSITGCNFNIGSPKQLGEILFEHLKLDNGKKLKSGAYSTDISTLEELSYSGHVIADLIIEWRHLSKLKSTYTEALQAQININTGRIHTNFTLCTTSTGRFSSINPNLQNIPIRTEEGNKIRSAFIASPGRKLLSADYSQIELRLLAHIADIKTLQQAFIEGKDIHSVTASQVFKVNENEVDHNLRRKAKTINFGIIYGISAFGLAKRLNIDRREASDYINAYFNEYPGIEQYMENIKREAHEQSYVKTLLGRKCYFKDINSSNQTLKSFSERAAINAPLQGTAADIIREAMVKVDCLLRENNLDARIILQVHDELLFEVSEKDLDKLVPLVKSCMEVKGYKVPIIVDISSGQNWAELKEDF